MKFLTKIIGVLSVLAASSQAQLVVSHMSATGGNNLNLIRPYLRVENQSSASVDLSKISLDYLIYEDNINAGSLVAECWYSSATSCADMTAEITAIPLQQDATRKANVRVRLGFRTGSLAAGQNLTIQWGLHEQGWQHLFNESDDWSFTVGDGQWHADPRVAVVVGGQVAAPAMVWKGQSSSLPDPITFKAGDVVKVTATGSSYILDNGDWVLLAEAGKVGATGPIGLTGPIGAKGPQGVPGVAGKDGKDGVIDPATLALIAKLGALVAKLAEGNLLYDTRDGTAYKIVKIGTQTWMAENLNYAGAAGTNIGVCYNNDPNNCAIYGRLYNWAEVMAGAPSSDANPSGVQGICPAGWHVPSDPEWTTLQDFVDPTNATTATKLRSTSGWAINTGMDTYGFRALPGGYFDPTSQTPYGELGRVGKWYSATEAPFAAWYRCLSDDYEKMFKSGAVKTVAYTLRCVQN